MLHEADTPTYRQQTWRLAAPARWEGEAPDFHIETLGRFHGKGGFRLEKLVGDRHSLHIVQGGAGSVEIDGAAYAAGPGVLFAFFPGMYVKYYDEPKRPWRYTWVGLRGTRVDWALGAMGIRKQSPVGRVPEGLDMEPLFREVEDAYGADKVPPLFPVAAAWRLAAALAAPGTPAGRGRAGLAESVRAIMDQDFHLPLSIDDIAQCLGVTRTTVFRKFRAAYGKSPKQYLDGRRLAAARELLLLGRSSVKEVAHACGFASPHYFSRAFRAHFGKPPGQARQAQPTIKVRTGSTLKLKGRSR